MLLYKKCEVCGNKINKLQNVWNLYELSEHNNFSIICQNCQAQYQPNTIIYMLLRFLPKDIIFGNLFCILLVWLVLPPMQWWVIIIISIACWHIMNFCILCIMPFCKYDTKKCKEETKKWQRIIKTL